MADDPPDSTMFSNRRHLPQRPPWRKPSPQHRQPLMDEQFPAVGNVWTPVVAMKLHLIYPSCVMLHLHRLDLSVYRPPHRHIRRKSASLGRPCYQSKRLWRCFHCIGRLLKWVAIKRPFLVVHRLGSFMAISSLLVNFLAITAIIRMHPDSI